MQGTDSICALISLAQNPNAHKIDVKEGITWKLSDGLTPKSKKN